MFIDSALYHGWPPAMVVRCFPKGQDVGGGPEEAEAEEEVPGDYIHYRMMVLISTKWLSAGYFKTKTYLFPLNVLCMCEDSQSLEIVSSNPTVRARAY